MTTFGAALMPAEESLKPWVSVETPLSFSFHCNGFLMSYCEEEIEKYVYV